MDYDLFFCRKQGTIVDMENLKSLVVAGILILIIIAAGTFFYGKIKNTSQSITSQNKTTGTMQANGEQEILLTNKGFSPDSVTIKIGTRVKWTNTSSGLGSIDSDPHPIHSSYPPMNFGQFSNGSSVSLVFNKSGTYHYYNHLNLQQKGTVMVK